VNPAVWAFRILQETVDPRFAPCRRGTIADNLIVWTEGQVRGLVNVGPNVEVETFRFEANLWWCGGSEQPLVERLPGTMVFPQITGIDPALSEEEFSPKSPEAKPFGHRAGTNDE
jgi:hypothetical protein